MSLKPYVLDGPKELTVVVRLTERERQVLELIADGKQNKEIAALLNVSVRTVKYFAEHLRMKLGTIGGGRGGLVAAAMRNGLVK